MNTTLNHKDGMRHGETGDSKLVKTAMLFAVGQVDS